MVGFYVNVKVGLFRRHLSFLSYKQTIRAHSEHFGKQLSPSVEMPNPSGNDFRRARKCQTLRETTFAKRGNAKPLGKWLSPCAEMPNHSENDFLHARKSFFGVFLQCVEAWKTSFCSFCSVQKHEKLLFSLSAVCSSMKNFFLLSLQCAEACFLCFVGRQHAFFSF